MTTAVTLTPAQKVAIADVRNTLVKARMSREIWWTIEGVHPLRADIERAIHFYQNLFGALSTATFIAYITSLASLFDENSKSVSLLTIPGIENTEGFEDLWSRGRKLFRFRSKVIVHRDSEVLGKNFGGQLDLSPDWIQDVLEDACRCFDIAASKTGEQKVPQLTCEDELLSLCTDVNRNYPPNMRTP